MVTLSQPYTWPPAIFLNELYARTFQRALDGSDGLVGHCPPSLLEIDDG